LERLLDQLDDAVEVRVDVRVPGSDRTKPCPSENRITHGVMISLQVFGVLAAVDFDDQAVLEADKVEIEAQQRRLPTEVKPVSAHLAKLLPEAIFLRRHALAQLTGALG
jgi:hypothetical protein